MRATGTHKGSYVGIAPTNKSIVIEACSIIEIKNGKTIRSRMYADNVKLLQQLGALSLPRATAAS
jgi:predicted ester cyclase